jgi:hypothetical protein
MGNKSSNQFVDNHPLAELSTLHSDTNLVVPLYYNNPLFTFIYKK